MLTEKDWLAQHPYLRSVADFHASVEAAVGNLPSTVCCVPKWNDYLDEFQAGVPLLYSSNSTIDLKPVRAMVDLLIEKLTSMPLPSSLALQVRELALELRHTSEASVNFTDCLFDKNPSTTSHRGLLRFLGWAAMVTYLQRVIGAFGSWRDEERWMRNYCPTCGSLPAMAQLVGTDPGRMRFLHCGCCGSRWRYRRVECPFCEHKHDHRLAVLAVEGEGGLRLDYCESCGGYLKTYEGQGQEVVLLADWTSIHLDVIAQDRGLKRLAASLYKL